jgi:hypothetical protein
VSNRTVLFMLPALAFGGSAAGAALLGDFPGGPAEAVVLVSLGVVALLAPAWLALSR